MQHDDQGNDAIIPRFEYRAIIKFLVAQGKNAHEIYEQFITSYGELSPSYSSIFLWHRKFISAIIHSNTRNTPDVHQMPSLLKQ